MMTTLTGYSSPRERQLREDTQRRNFADRTIRAIARHHNVSYGDLMSHTRGSPAASNARIHAMAVIRWSTTWSFPAIARVFYRRDHTTVRSAVLKWERVLAAEFGAQMVAASKSERSSS